MPAALGNGFRGERGGPVTFPGIRLHGRPELHGNGGPIPTGYESTRTCTANLSAGVCTITNVLRSATINVLKDFTDNNPANVNVNGFCTSGTLVTLDGTASEANSASFTLLGFNPGATCNFMESVPVGYIGNQAGCQNVAVVRAGTSSCTMINTPRRRH